jgi:histidinol-phosphate aminotransferase
MNYPILPRATHGGPQGCDNDILDFSVNTNPLGPNSQLVRVWREADPSTYPDPYYRQARAALAAYHGVDPRSVVLGVGASELLHRIVRAFVQPGEVAISLGAPFGELARAVALQQAKLQTIERTAEMPLPYTRLLYLSNPHNPTGHTLPPTRWADFPLVVVDEAYRPFLAEPFDWPLWPNVIRVQSPGKAHGLLGLRLAYALAPPDLAAHLVNLEPAWAIPGPVAAVLTALPEQEPFLRQTLPQVRHWATELAHTLGATPTGLHFFTVNVSDTRRVTTNLQAQGIRVRDCTSFGYPDRVRIATRLPAENQQLLNNWTRFCLGADVPFSKNDLETSGLKAAARWQKGTNESDQ